MIDWPDIAFGPVNLWTVPKQGDKMSAYTEGRTAYHDGVNIDQNPYVEGTDAADWEQGWDDAYDDNNEWRDYDDFSDDCDCDACRLID